MIETEPAIAKSASFERELAPNVWLRQDEEDGQYVEIVLPPFELNDLIEECTRSFPEYVIQLCEGLARREPTALTPGTNLSPELAKGILNTQLLGTVLARYSVCNEQAVPLLPELNQAFGLAIQGRLRLTADPLPDT